MYEKSNKSVLMKVAKPKDDEVFHVLLSNQWIIRQHPDAYTDWLGTDVNIDYIFKPITIHSMLGPKNP